MTPHPNAEYLRALADGKRVMVQFRGFNECDPLDLCSTTVHMSLLRPESVPQEHRWSFHIEQEQPK
jgi:hypothetical protein